MKRIVMSIMLSLILIVGLVGCGGGGGSGSSSGDTATLTVGKLSNVKGVYYKTTSGLEGTTSQDGSFKYNKGDDISFYVGEANLGTIKANTTITMFSFKNPAIVAQILYSLDDDKDPSNGLDVSYIENKNQNRQVKILASESTGGNFNVDEITSYDPKYAEFLKRHNANIFHKTTASTEEFIKEVERIIPPQSKTEPSFALKLIIGTSDFIPFSPSALFLQEVQDLYNGDNYEYRVRIATLARLYTGFIQKLQGKAETVLQDAEALSKASSAFNVKIMTSLDETINIANFIVGDDSAKKFMKSTSKTSLEAAVDLSVEGGVNPTAKLASTLMYDCLDDVDGDLESCAFDSAENAVKVLAYQTLSENDPMLPTIDAGASMLKSTAKAWTDCVVDIRKKSKILKSSKECIESATKAFVGNSLVLVTEGIKIGTLVNDQNELNAVNLAFEYFMAKKYLFRDNIPCEVISYYPSENMSEYLEECREVWKNRYSKYDLKNQTAMDATYSWITTAMIESGKSNTTKFIGITGYDHDIFEQTVEYLENEYETVFKVYNEAFSKYIGLNGKVDENKVYETAKKDVVFYIQKDNVHISEDTSGSVNISACVDIDTPVSLDNIDIEMKLKKDGGDKIFTMNSYKHFSKTQKDICGDVHGVEWDSEVYEGDSIPFIMEATLKYNRTRALDKRGYTHTDRGLFIQKYLANIPTRLSFSDSFEDDQKVVLNAFLQDGRQKASRSSDYKYVWTINAQGCNTYMKSSSSPTLTYDIPENCKSASLNVSLEVLDHGYDDEFIAKTSRILDPILSGDELQIIKQDIVLDHGDIKTYTPSIKGGEAPYIIEQFVLGDGLNERSKTKESIEFSAENLSDSIKKSTLGINVSDSRGNSLSMSNSVTIHPASEEATIGFIKRMEDPVADFTEYNAVKPGTAVEKKWGLQNTSKVTLKNVTLRWNSTISDSKLEHSRLDIVLGDMAPTAIKSILLEINIPGDAVADNHFGRFDIWHTDNDGNERILKYQLSKKDASVIYTLYTTSKDTQPPVITEKNVEVKEDQIVGEFNISQKNHQVKNLRVYFSLFDSFPQDTSRYSDIGGYDSIQDDGYKTFSFDASLWRGKSVYWKIVAANKDGYVMTNPPKGIVYLESIQEPEPTISDFKLEESGSKVGKVKVIFNVSSNNSLSDVKAHCSRSSSVSTDRIYDYHYGVGDKSSKIEKTIYLGGYSEWVGEKVYCKVEVKDTENPSVTSEIKSIELSSSQAPTGVVTGVTASNGTYYDRIKVSWNALSGISDDSIYEVYRCKDKTESSCKKINDIHFGMLYEDEDVSFGNTYYYRVKVYNPITKIRTNFSEYAAGSLNSSSKEVQSPIASQGTYGDKVHVSWAHVVNATHYTISACTKITLSDQVDQNCIVVRASTSAYSPNYDGPVTWYDHTSAIPGKKYWYYVRAKIDGDYGSFSSWSNPGYSGLEKPSVPTISINKSTNTLFELYIPSSGDQGEIKNEIYRCSNSLENNCELIGEISPYGKLLDTVIDTDRDYYYRAKSVSYSGNKSDFSDYVIGYISTTKPTVSEVSPTEATKGEATVFTVNGTNLPSTIAMSLHGNLSCSDEYDITTESAKIECTPNTTGRVRFYVGVEADGDSISGSVDLYVTVEEELEPTPGVPSLSSPNNGSSTTDTTPTLSWSSVSGAMYYKLALANTDGNVIYNLIDVYSTSKTTTILAAGKEYRWSVKACNDSGCSEGSDYRSFIVEEEPEPIPGVPSLSSPSDGSSTTDTTPTLSWNSVSGATYYKLALASTDSNVIYNLIDVYSTSKTTTTLTRDKEYRWSVKACNDSGCSEGSSYRSFTVAPEDVSTVSGLEASDGLYADKIRVTWEEDLVANSYKVFRCMNTSVNSCSELADVAATSYDDLTALADSAYYYRIKAVGLNNTSDYSDYDAGTLSSAATLPVSNKPDASDGTYYNKIEISWDEISGVTAGANYELYRCTDTSTSSCVLISRRTNTSHTDEKTDGIQANKTYYYRIRIQGTGDEVGDFSNYDAGYLDPVEPVVTEPIASQGTHGDRVHVSWVHVSGASSYDIYACDTFGIYSEDVLSSSECRSITSQSAYHGDTGEIYTEVYDTNVVSGVKYWYHVRAKKDGDYGEFSRWSNSGYAGLETPLVPTISTVVDVTTYGDPTPTLSITPTPPGEHGAEYYKVYRCTDTQIESCILVQDVLPYNHVYDNKISYNTNYYYRARSVSYSGNISEFSDYAVGNSH